MRLITCVVLCFALGLSPSCASAPAAVGGPTGDYLGGRLAARVNDLDDAARAFERAHAGAPEDVSILKDAFFYRIAAGDVDDAVILAERIIARSPDEDDGLARLTLAAAQIRLGNLEAAREHLRGDISAPFLKSISHLLDVSIERETGGAQAALELLKNPAPGVFTGLSALHAAFLTEATGDAATAKASYQETLKTGDFLAVRAYGAFLERTDAASAREYYEFLAQQPAAGGKIARSGLSRLDRGARSKEFASLTARQGAAAAVHVFAQAMLQQATDERARAALAGFNVGAPRFNFPLVLVQIAVWLDPGLDEAKYLAGSILQSYGDFAAASGALRAVTPNSPLFAQARMSIAAGLSAEGKGREAILLIKDSLRRDPTSQELRFALAGHYDALGDHARAVAIYDHLIKARDDLRDAADWRHFLARGASHLELGAWPRAEADLKRAVELAPEEAAALNYLGYSWAERGLNLDEAFRLIEKAVELEPQSGAIIDSLGWAQYQLGRYREAALNLEKAAALEPSDPTITDHLGDAYWRLDRLAEARFQWRRALELEPTKEQRMRIEEKLADGLAPAANEKAADGGP